MNRNLQAARSRTIFFTVIFTGAFSFAASGQAALKGAAAVQQHKDTVSAVSAEKLNATTVKVHYSDQQYLLLDFYSDHIFRLFRDPSGGSLRAPEAVPPAQILTDSPRKPVSGISIGNTGGTIAIATKEINI